MFNFMKSMNITILLCFFFFEGFGSSLSSKESPVSDVGDTVIISGLDKNEILRVVRKATDWQYANPTGKELNTWDYAPFYHGIFSLYAVTKEAKYYDMLIEMGNTVNWELRPRPYDANEYAIAQTFIDLYQLTGNEQLIDKSRYMMDMPLARALKPEVEFEGNKYWWEWWTWCDALYMAPPTYTMMGVIKNEPKYLDFMSEMWWLTSDYLYSEEDSLYFRDDRFFDLKTPNGKKIFWSRGNGWVIAGLARVLDYLPKEYPTRIKFEQQYLQMAKKIAAIQLEEGFWGQSLLDPITYPQKETSGTAFFVYSLAWGVNNGFLDKEEFLPVITKGWKSLLEAVDEDGMLGYVQQVGYQPDQVSADDFEAYGTGAFILAGIELYKMK